MASIHKTYNIQIAMNMRKEIVEDRNECMHMADTRIFIWANTCHLTFVDRHAMSKYVIRLYQKRSFQWYSSNIYTLLYHWGIFYVDSLSLLLSLSSPFSLSFSPPFLSSLFLSPLSSPPPCVFLPPGHVRANRRYKLLSPCTSLTPFTGVHGFKWNLKSNQVL